MMRMMDRISHKRRDELQAYVLAAPMLALTVVFVLVPFLYALSTCLYKVSYYTEPEYVGFNNFYLVLTDKNFINSFPTVLKYILYVTPAQFILSFLIANLIFRLPKRLAGVTKASIYIPTIISGVIVSVIFGFIYDYQYGLANQILRLFQIRGIVWTNNKTYSMLAVALPSIWLGLGTMSLFMLAGLNDIPSTYYEAADLDGANGLVKLFRITLPCMRNTMIYLIVTSFVGGMQTMELPRLLTGGGPLRSTMTPNLMIYNAFLNNSDMGYSVAGSLIMFVLLAGFCGLIFKLVNSEKSAE